MISRTGASARAAPAAASRAAQNSFFNMLVSFGIDRVVATRLRRAALGSGKSVQPRGLGPAPGGALVFRTGQEEGIAQLAVVRHVAAHARAASRCPTRCARAWPPPAPARRGCPRRTAACPRRCGPGPTLSPRRPAGPPGPTTRERPARSARRPRAPGPWSITKGSGSARRRGSRQLGAVQMQAQMPAQRRDQADHMVEDGRVSARRPDGARS